MSRTYTPLKIAPPPSGRRFAIGDIHGCHTAFTQLLENQLLITRHDQLFLLGDLIDRGPNSALVLETVMELKAQGYQVYPLMGNHEEKLLLAWGCGMAFFEEYLAAYQSLDLLEGDLGGHLGLIASFEYCIESEGFLLSHPGINEAGISPFTDVRGMFPALSFDFSEMDFASKTQVHGHLTRTVGEIQASVSKRERRFSIDSGCYRKGGEFGQLTALELDTWELFHQR